MSSRRERWLRTCPAYHPEQSGVRREYENARQAIRVAQWHRSQGDGSVAWDWMEADARATCERLEHQTDHEETTQ